MAYDKVIDSSVLDASLTTVANAIRTACGASGSMAFPEGFVSVLQNMKKNMVVRTTTIASDITGTASTVTLLSNDEFIKEHYAEQGFFAFWFPTTPVTAANGVLMFGFQGNRNIGAASKIQTGFGFRCTSASAIGLAGFNTAIKGEGYAQHMRANSSGKLFQYLHTGYILRAGTYNIVLIALEE